MRFGDQSPAPMTNPKGINSDSQEPLMQALLNLNFVHSARSAATVQNLTLKYQFHIEEV